MMRATDPSNVRAESASGRRWLVGEGAVGALLALILIGLAVPRLIAAVIDLPADRVVFYIRQGVDVSDAALDGLVVARKTSLEWHEDGPGWRDLAAAELERARRGRESSWPSAEVAVRRGLELAPVDPVGWARLTHLAWQRHEDPELAARALRASIETGIYEPRLSAWRATMITHVWASSDDTERVIFESYLRELACWEPGALATARTDPELALRLDALLRTLHIDEGAQCPQNPNRSALPR